VVHLPHLLLVVLAHGLLDASGARLEPRWWVVVACLALPELLARACRAAYASGRFALGGRLHGCLRWSGPATHAVALFLGGWTALLAQLAGRPSSVFDWPTAWHAAMFLPWLCAELLAIDARARLFVATRDRAAWRRHQWRSLGATLAPLALYGGLAGAVGLSEELRVRVEEIGLYEAAFIALLLAATLAWMPRVVAWAWDTRELPRDERRERLERFLQRHGVAGTRLAEWRTGHQAANAAVVGLSRRSRTVYLSDSLLAQMDDAELEAVLAHEVAHVRLRHVPLFLLASAAWILLVDLAARAFAPDDEWLALGWLVVGFAAWLAGFTWLSRRAELQADLAAIEMVGGREALVRALDKVGGRLRDVAGWRHFSVADRVRFLERAAVEPALRRGLDRTLRVVALGAALLGLLGGALHAARLVREAPAQHAWAELRLGRWSAANARLARHGAVDEGLCRLAERARELAPEDLDSDGLAERASRALRAGRADEGVEWLALAALRDPARWTSAADAAARGDAALAQEELDARLGDEHGRRRGAFVK
jgi:Zn-dependent protease with chaperone function